MAMLGDDELGLIFNWIQDPIDRKSLSEVCKQWLRVEGITRSSIRVLECGTLRYFLPRFQNLIRLESSRLLYDSDLLCVAQFCPKLEVLDLKYKRPRPIFDDDLSGLDDFGNCGLCAVANGCNKLIEVVLRKRRNIGDCGVISLVQLSKNLTSLDLGRCSSITDQTLETIGGAKSITVLNLQGCFAITDRGLASLTKGSTSMTLKKLILTNCFMISDNGVSFLQRMSCLEELSLSGCTKVTDIGVLVIAGIRSLKILKLSCLHNISDDTITAIAKNCLNLIEIDLSGVECLTGSGFRALLNHKCLESLVAVSCYTISDENIEELVEKCKSFKYILLEYELKPFFQRDDVERMSRFCTLHWGSLGTSKLLIYSPYYDYYY